MTHLSLLGGKHRSLSLDETLYYVSRRAIMNQLRSASLRCPPTMFVWVQKKFPITFDNPVILLYKHYPHLTSSDQNFSILMKNLSFDISQMIAFNIGPIFFGLICIPNLYVRCHYGPRKPISILILLGILMN